MYKNILFDLDGTLTDPGVGITNSVMYALAKFGIEEENRESLYKFIGPPLSDSFRKYYGFSDEKIEPAIGYYREYYKSDGIYENDVYEGIEKLLAELKNMGARLIVATSKPEPFANEVLRYFELDKYFDCVAGATMDGARVKKSDIIKYALDICKIEDLSLTIMIGDREHDIEGAKLAGIDSIGVLYGYGSYDELKNAGATYIAERVGDIMGLIPKPE